VIEPLVVGDAILYHGDCIQVMREMEANSVEAIVTDPPYLLNFMGKDFDSQHKSLPGDNEGQQMQAWHSAWVKEAYRVLKPGGYLVAFGGSRTVHRLMIALEDEGFWLHPIIGWVNGSSFPKATNLSKMLDKSLGLEREDIGPNPNKIGCTKDMRGGRLIGNKTADMESICRLTAPASPEAAQWEGWFYGKQSLKPAMEPAAVAQKPPEGRMVDNIRKHGTGAIHIDACRVGTNESWAKNISDTAPIGKPVETVSEHEWGLKEIEKHNHPEGRWPPNLLLDGSEAVSQMFPESKSCNSPSSARPVSKYRPGQGNYQKQGPIYPGDSGSAARFFPHLGYSDDDLDADPLFYCGKATKRDRDSGCEELNLVACGLMEDDNYNIKTGSGNSRDTKRHNYHPTCKPTSLMRWITKLVLPPNGVVLDPFMGSGSTLKAACLEGMKSIGIERDAEYFAIAVARVKHAQQQPNLKAA
jgi:site-specific DNA-methyltransferase (adenine-specific)